MIKPKVERVKRFEWYNFIALLGFLYFAIVSPVMYIYEKFSRYQVTLNFDAGVGVMIFVFAIAMLLLIGWLINNIGFNRWGLSLVIVEIILIIYGFKVIIVGFASISETLILISETFIGSFLLSLPFGILIFPIPRKVE